MTGINSNEASKLREVDREVGSRQVCDSCVGRIVFCTSPAPLHQVLHYLPCAWACLSWLSASSKEKEATAATRIIFDC